MHDTNKDSPIYRDVSGDGDEFRRAMKHACAGIRPSDALTFRPEDESWKNFYSGDFASAISPHFTATYSASGVEQTERVIELDSKFAKGLKACTRERLTAAARTIFEARSGAGAMRLLERLRDRHSECTFTTAFAAHAASFNIPLLHATVSYLALEWRAGNEAAGLELENSHEWDKVFTGQLLAAPEPIRQVLARSMRGWADVA
jgi:hypothetical protein